jgi:heme/copper-type cytochrome/quinol oxidase subunit 2
MAIFTGGIAYGVQGLIGGEPDEGVMVDGVREFNITKRQWSITPAVIKVNPGEKVRFIVTSADIKHGFAINELGINLSLEPEVASIHETVVPIDIAPGVYTMYCSVFCGIGHPYMKGNIIIGTPTTFGGINITQLLPYLGTAIMAGIVTASIILVRRRPR